MGHRNAPSRGVFSFSWQELFPVSPDVTSALVPQVLVPAQNLANLIAEHHSLVVQEVLFQQDFTPRRMSNEISQLQSSDIGLFRLDLELLGRESGLPHLDWNVLRAVLV